MANNGVQGERVVDHIELEVLTFEESELAEQ